MDDHQWRSVYSRHRPEHQRWTVAYWLDSEWDVGFGAAEEEAYEAAREKALKREDSDA